MYHKLTIDHKVQQRTNKKQKPITKQSPAVSDACAGLRQRPGCPRGLGAVPARIATRL